MAVSTDNAFSGPYLTNGVTTVFPFTFTAPSADEVDVVLRDAAGNDTVLSGFTVTLNPGGGGAAVFAAAPAPGHQLYVLLEPHFTQDIAFENGSAWRAEPVNEGYDRSASRDQALKREVDRGLKVPVGEQGLAVPIASVRASRALFFNEAGDVDLISVDDFSAPARDAAGQAEAAANFAEEFSGPAYATIAAGEAATATGHFFRVAIAGTSPVEYKRYQRTAGGSVEAAPLATTAYLASPQGADDLGLARKDALAAPTGAQTIGTVDGNVQDALDGLQPFTVMLRRFAPELTDDDAWIRALSAVLAAGGGRIELPARDIITTKTWFIPSQVRVNGQGDATCIIFSATDPNVAPTPRQGNLVSSAVIMAGTNPDDMLPGAYSDSQTGDYATTSTRAFAADVVLHPGATQFTVPSGTANDIEGGDYIWLERGIVGWHSAIHEMAQVARREGDTVYLTKPLRYEYIADPTDPFNEFMDRYGYDGAPPPGVSAENFNAFRQCGWRRVNPVVNSALSNCRVRTISKFGGYANLAIGIFRSFRACVENVTVEGGGVWNLDSHGTAFRFLKLDRVNSEYADTDFLPGNGSTDTTIVGLEMKGGNLHIEEGCCGITVDGRTFGPIFVNQYNRDVKISSIDVTTNIGYAIRVEKSKQVTASGSFISTQPAIQYGTKEFFKLYPGATLEHWSAVNDYFDGTNFRLLAGTFILSTANNSLEIYSEQPITCDDVEVGGSFGDAFSIPVGGPGYVIGDLRRRRDGLRVGSPVVSGRPAFFPASPRMRVWDNVNDRSWSVVNLAAKLVANAPSPETFTPDVNAQGGGVKAGDVTRVLIENTSQVTAADGKLYATGAARAWHYSVVSGVNTDTGLVTLTTAVPADWAVKVGGGISYFARWG